MDVNCLSKRGDLPTLVFIRYVTSVVWLCYGRSATNGGLERVKCGNAIIGMTNELMQGGYSSNHFILCDLNPTVTVDIAEFLQLIIKVFRSGVNIVIERALNVIIRSREPTMGGVCLCVCVGGGGGGGRGRERLLVTAFLGQLSLPSNRCIAASQRPCLPKC